eukprot:7543298-Lingulodinium_polyedra.AAC.1
MHRTLGKHPMYKQCINAMRAGRASDAHRARARRAHDARATRAYDAGTTHGRRTRATRARCA